MAGSGGPWGGSPGGQGGDNRGQQGGGNGGGGGRKPGPEGPQIPEIDELMKKGQEQLRVLMGGRGGNGQGGGRGPQGTGSGRPLFTKGTVLLAVAAAAVVWGMSSFYTVKPEERSVELFLGEYRGIGNPGLNFAPWPLVRAAVAAGRALPVVRSFPGARHFWPSQPLRCSGVWRRSIPSSRRNVRLSSSSVNTVASASRV